MGDYLTIHDVAVKLSVSTDTIRRWEKKGLIKSRRSQNNYRLFSVDEISRLKNKISGAHTGNNYRVLKNSRKTNYKVIDLFAGAGGTALGLENAGLNHVLLNEIDSDAVNTLRLNRPTWKVAKGDIADIDFSKYYGTIDVVEGGFPCQAFSLAGKKLGLEDTRGTLFYEFARVIKEVRPKVAIGENVKGLLLHDEGRTLSTMLTVLTSLGYRVAYKLARSQYLDVPQKRERLIIIAVREDLNTPIVFPKEKDYTISLREALGNCPKSGGQEYSDWKKSIMTNVPEGGYWKDLPKEMQMAYMKQSYFLGGGKTGMARRLSWDEPSLTLTCNPAQKQTERCHPKETRPLSVREYARIQTFPDDWRFYGSVSSQYKQIGNAVPVNLGYYMGMIAIGILEGKWDKSEFEVVELL